jgi:hypothetical protein
MEELEKYVVSAINKGYITVPITGYEDGQGAKHCLQPYGGSFGLDGCRAKTHRAWQG